MARQNDKQRELFVAARNVEKAIQRAQAALPPGDTETILILSGGFHLLASLYEKGGDVTRAEVAAKRRWELAECNLHPQNPEIRAAQVAIHLLYLRSNQHAKAVVVEQHAVQFTAQHYGVGHPEHIFSLRIQAAHLRQMKRDADACSVEAEIQRLSKADK